MHTLNPVYMAGRGSLNITKTVGGKLELTKKHPDQTLFKLKIPMAGLLNKPIEITKAREKLE